MEKKRNVLFVWPPSELFNQGTFKHFSYFGETIGYMSKFPGLEVKVMDLAAASVSIKKVMRAIYETDFLFVCVENYNTEPALKISRLGRLVNPPIKIGGYGSAAVYLPEFILRNGEFDMVVDNGEWEYGLKGYIDHILGEKSLDETPQIMVKEDGTTKVVGKKRIMPPEEWGYPALDKLPLEAYAKITGKNEARLLVIRGCGYGCSFCQDPVLFGKIERRRTTDNVMGFVEKYHKNFETLRFDGSTFTHDREWVMELCEELGRYNIKWDCSTRVDRLDEGLVSAMAKAGCNKINIGIETLNPDTQKRIKKILPVEVIENAFDLLKRKDIKGKALLMAGLPGQTKEEVYFTLNFFRERGIPVRIKEYFPFQDLSSPNITIDDIRRFDRSDFYHHPIEGITKSEFIRMLYPIK